MKDRKFGINQGLGYSLTLLACAIYSAFNPDLQIYQNSDSLIHVLSAGEHWTPYYWGQDRLGMFYSLFGIPFDDLFTKLLVMNSLQLFVALLFFPLLP